MFCTVLSASVFGVESIPVHVEADVGNGLPSFSMVGFLSMQVKEAQERVRTALKNSGIRMEPKKITVNLAPADLRKSGTAFDLPIAVAIAAAYGKIEEKCLQGILIAGELSLNGEVLPVCGGLLLAEGAAKMNCHTCILPRENVKEGAAVQGVRLIGVRSLTQALRYLKGEEEIEPEKNIVNGNVPEAAEPDGDFADINGQESVKRAAEVAVAGFHNLLMVGPPGSGKSMIARRIPTILPQMTWEEQLEVTKIYSIMGLISPANPILKKRPFRSPHHTITAKAMAGGGQVPRPGEISLAHNGILFLDELAEFSRDALEVLRQPLEEKRVVISRGGRNYCFPANFMVVAATNLCPCGQFPNDTCTCTPGAVRRYQGKISGPFLDRMDLTVEVPAVRFDTLGGERAKESSAQIRERIWKAREIQQNRYQEHGFLYNSQLTSAAVKTFCKLGRKEQALMKSAFEKLDLSARSYYRTLKVARTIADLEGSEAIACEHLNEALCYRTINKKYWAGE